ncbi:hypothetical protein L5515_010311 [Caenorhabditis briggsae]|uniref:DUF38 domain-containing protein n=1 Tax=Caenorhabditis briggsae TaxID=6238 RepID=A0AAE9EUA3_CAEBR|nr:hypothetical protein L5515_010311 [Caenorhabditis briggsae]
MDWKTLPSGQTYGDFIENLFNERVPFREAHRRLLQEIGKSLQGQSSTSTQRPGMKRPMDASEEPKPSKTVRQEQPEAPIPEEPPGNLNERQRFVQRWKRERVEYYPGIYDPQNEFPEKTDHIIQIEQVRDYYEELAQAIMDGYPRDQNDFGFGSKRDVWDLLFFRMISPRCCASAEKFAVKSITRLKIVIFLDKVEIKIQDDDRKMLIEYRRNERGKEEVKKRRIGEEQIIEYDTPSYKILAACDFYFLLRMPLLKLERLGIKMYDMPTPTLPRRHRRYVDISLLRIIIRLIAEKKPSPLRVEEKLTYMFTREFLVLNEDPIQVDPLINMLECEHLKTIKLRVWDDSEVYLANNYPNMTHFLANSRFSIDYLRPFFIWKNTETLNLRGCFIFTPNDNFEWKFVYFFQKIIVYELSADDVWDAQQNLQLEENEHQRYTVICDEEEELIPDEIGRTRGARRIPGNFDKHTSLGFPLKHTRRDRNGMTYVLKMGKNEINVTVRPTTDSD